MLVEVNCESDFVARTDDFQKLIQDILTEIEKAGDAASDAWLTSPDGPVVALIKPVIGKLGENMAAPRFVRHAGKGYVGQYIHPGAKVGVQVEFTGVTPELADREEFSTLVKEIAMQIAAASRCTRRGTRCRQPCSTKNGQFTVHRSKRQRSRRTSSRRSSKASLAVTTSRSSSSTRIGARSEDDRRKTSSRRHRRRSARPSPSHASRACASATAQ